MGTFRRVEGAEAGPTALGILVPPGSRTFLILRPRALAWDLLMCKGADDLTFAQLAHDEASAAAQGLYRALRGWSAGGPGTIDAIRTSEGNRLRLAVGGFALVVCPRIPGQPYSPIVCSDGEAVEATCQLRTALCPQGEQEVYFNMRFFER